MYREHLRNLRNDYIKELESIRTQLGSLPAGSFFCSKNGKYYKWYHSVNKKRHCISKKNRPLAEQLAYRKYLTIRVKELEEEIKAIDVYLTHPSPYVGKSASLLSNPPYSDLLSTHLKPSSQELSEWVEMPYHTNEAYPENLKFQSPSGHLLRSKSELLIDMTLFQHKLPFRYECELRLGDVIFYPDFTIRHPATLNTFYWEHFGMMDQPFYAQKACEKLQLYCQNGIIPDINLITTFETRKNPLTLQTIHQKISSFLL